jgi:hypothetical protein
MTVRRVIVDDVHLADLVSVLGARQKLLPGLSAKSGRDTAVAVPQICVTTGVVAGANCWPAYMASQAKRTRRRSGPPSNAEEAQVRGDDFWERVSKSVLPPGMT